MSDQMIFSEMLEKLSDNITAQNLQALKYQCKDIIPQSKIDDIKTSFMLFETLEEDDKLGPNNLSHLKRILNACRLQTLAEFVEYFEKNGSLSNEIINPPSCLNEAIDFVVDNIGSRDWRFLVRDLGVKETDITYIVDNHPRDVRNQIYQCFSLWKSREGSKATVHRLIPILKKMCRNDILEGIGKLNG